MLVESCWRLRRITEFFSDRFQRINSLRVVTLDWVGLSSIRCPSGDEIRTVVVSCSQQWSSYWQRYSPYMEICWRCDCIWSSNQGQSKQRPTNCREGSMKQGQQNRNVQWLIHSNKYRKKDHVEEKNTLNLASGKEKLKRQIEAKLLIIRWSKKRATICIWEQNVFIYNDWL